MKKILIILSSSLLLLAIGCKSGLDDPQPTKSIDSESAITDAYSLESALLGAYDGLQNDGYNDYEYYSQYYTFWPDLAADNLRHSGTFTQNREVDAISLTPSNATMDQVWRQIYATCNRANVVLEASQRLSKQLSPAQMAQFQGEALFIRALTHFDVARMFSTLPYAANNPGIVVRLKSTSAKADALVPQARSSLQESYQQIITDLRKSDEHLTTFETEMGYGLYPNRASSVAAKALLARAYLYIEKWDSAHFYADKVINEGGQSLVSKYRDIFEAKNGPESIFELEYKATDKNNLGFWVATRPNGRYEYAPDKRCLAAFDSGDVRLPASIDTSGPLLQVIKYFRYATGDDNVIILRLAEMHLIRAEAANKLGRTAEAIADLNTLRQRAQVADLASSLTAAEVGLAIERERQAELCFEGHRWFDLRRTGRAGAVLNPPAPAPAIPEWRLVFPIPQREIDTNPSCQQNPGY